MGEESEVQQSTGGHVRTATRVNRTKYRGKGDTVKYDTSVMPPPRRSPCLSAPHFDWQTPVEQHNSTFTRVMLFAHSFSPCIYQDTEDNFIFCRLKNSSCSYMWIVTVHTFAFLFRFIPKEAQTYKHGLILL